MGNIDSPQIEFLNRIEEMWYTNRYEDTWIPCDLFTMGVFFDEDIIQESDTYEVIMINSQWNGYSIESPNM